LGGGQIKEDQALNSGETMDARIGRGAKPTKLFIFAARSGRFKEYLILIIINYE